MDTGVATRIEGERYVGGEQWWFISRDGTVVLYFLPCRILAGGQGGPTMGIVVLGKKVRREVTRWDAHGPIGHWHGMRDGKGGAYDEVGAVGSRQDFPEDFADVHSQVAWSLGQIRNEAPGLLRDVGYLKAADVIDYDYLRYAVEQVGHSFEATAPLRRQAIDLNLM